MSEEPLSQPWTKEKLREVITNSIKEISPENRHNRCRSINGHVLLGLINNHNLPGLVYTVQPHEQDIPKLRFTEYWSFHAVGIIQLDKNLYAAYEETSEKNGEYFLEIGSLEQLSGQLQERFGSNWDLNFQTGNPEIDQRFSVAGKISQVTEMKRTNPNLKFTLKDITPDNLDQPPLALENKSEYRALGLKYMPTNIETKSETLKQKLRLQFTFSYA